MSYSNGNEAPKYLKKKVKCGQLEIDLEDRALIVNYEVEATVLGDYGAAMQTERKTHAKRIKLKKLDANTNIPALAEEIVDRCSLIAASKISQVENLLFTLQQNEVKRSMRADTRRDRQQIRQEEHKEDEDADSVDVACMEDLDAYLEKMYDEDTDSKVQGTGMILQLAKHAGNLEMLIQNEVLMGALSRLLKEDYKKSQTLVLNIMYIFFSFSTFSQLHPFLLNYQVGNGTMQVIRWEIKKRDVQQQELEALAQVAAAQQRGEDEEMWIHMDTRKSKKRGTRVDMERETHKVKVLMKKQEKLLYVCFHVLLNLAEDDKVERKMAKRNITENLLTILDRNNAELLILVVTFLKKLSIYKTNKNTMFNNNIVQLLVKFVPCSNQMLMQLVLHLLFNLSFDSSMREQMVKNSLIPKLVDLLKKPSFRAITLKLLYHISVDEKCKSMFTYTEAIPIIMQLIVNFPQNYIAKELAALAINLSINHRNAEMMCKGQGFRALIERMFKTKDVLLMKVIRNFSQWTLNSQHELLDGNSNSKIYKQKGMWAPYVVNLIKLAKSTSNSDLLIEVLGTLGNLTSDDLPDGMEFSDLIVNYSLVEFFHKHLVPGFSQDDVILEVVIIIGAMSLDVNGATLISSTPLIKLVIELLREKEDDSEIVLQILYTLYRLLRHRETANDLLYGNKMTNLVCSMLLHKNGVVRCMADQVLDLIMLHDEEHEESLHRRMKETKSKQQEDDDEEEEVKLRGKLSIMIRRKRFEAYNREWVNYIGQDEHNYGSDESDFEMKHGNSVVGHYLSSDGSIGSADDSMDFSRSGFHNHNDILKGMSIGSGEYDRRHYE